MKNSTFIKSLVVTLFVAFGVFALTAVMRPTYVGTRAGKADENYIKSENCLTCHESKYRSWSHTFHSKMTQEATSKAVTGDFTKNNTLEYLGVKAKMENRGSEFFMNFEYPDGKKESNKIYRTVGSRRMQQYVTKRNGQYIRLPISYDLENKRWMSLNGSFFYPDNDNFKKHEAQWDLNCVFCHNVKAQPNYNRQTQLANTEVAELGIACGACHGQGAEHAQMAGSPLTRASWFLNENADRKIVLPPKLDTDRSMMVCAHCHGQRVPNPPDRIAEIIAKGDPFDAGEDLSTFYTPVKRDTHIGDFSFAARFWNNGSPRLTAFEYQALTRSKCFVKGKPGNRINCLSCHTMHQGDPEGQLTDDMRTNQACNQCHQQFNAPEKLIAHTKHSAESAGSSCYACHMPQVVYGVMTFHPSHDITVPDPQMTATQAVPNACNQCHVDQSVNWAIAQTKNLWPEKFGGAQVNSDAQFNEPEGVRALFAGDAPTRALAANSLVQHSGADYYLPFLGEAFASENYPVVRFFAANGMAAAHWNLPKPDYLANESQRNSVLSQWLEQMGQAKTAQAKQQADKLRQRRKDVDLEVGE
jgi:predicted CXXCH cytochrome family protein